MNYVPLYIKTNNSLLSSLILIDELIIFAKKNNIKVLSITDNNMYGVIEFYHACNKNGIKPIVGLEVKIKDMIVVLYAINYNGYKNLLKINTLVNEKELLIDDISNYCDDLICILPFSSIKLHNELNKLYKYIFIGYKDEEEREHILTDNKLYFNETLYIYENEKNYLKYLYGIRDGVHFKDVHVYKKNNYIKLKDEVTDLKNNYLISELCNLELKFHQHVMPKYICPNNKNSYDYLKELCKNGMRNKLGDLVPVVYIDRLKHELKIIREMGFCDYFLIVWDYVEFAKRSGILVGPGRGSAAGSLVSYLLGITDIDPIKYNLLFERFLNPERISMPDIDIDFEFDRREEVIEYCVNKYGLKKVASIITFGTLGAKQAVRDVGRTMGLEIQTVDKVSKMLNSNMSIQENYDKNIKLRKMIGENMELSNLYKIASKFEGMKRHTSLHAAGIILSEYDIDEIIPIVKKDNMYSTAYSMDYLEEIGLLKMDLLALRTLTLATNIIEDIKKTEGISINFNEIELNDTKVISLFTNVLTTGIFQFESAGMMAFLAKFKPSNFEDIFASLALYRPGPMGNIDMYIKRKRGLEKIDYFHPSLEKVLKPTYGIIIYQEQIIEIVVIMAGYTLGEADVLRRAMSKKQEDILEKEKPKFVRKSIENGYSEELALKIFTFILKFASYGFNRGHSVSYAVISYRMAYFKVYYSKYFMKNLLNSMIDSEVKIREYISECKKMSINILPPDINESEIIFEVSKDGIRVPLTAIKGIGEHIVQTIKKAREERKFTDIFDFIARLSLILNKKIFTSLIYSGSLSCFGYNTKTLIENIDIFLNYASLATDMGSTYTLKPVINITAPYSDSEVFQMEEEVLGFYVTNHPVVNYKNKYNNNISLKKIQDYFDKVVEIIVKIDFINESDTKEGRKMSFLKVSDETSICEVIIFPSLYESLKLAQNNIIIVQGKVQKRFNKYQIIADKINIL